MRRVETRSLHRAVAGSSHTFLPLPPHSDKMAALVQVLRRASAPPPPPPPPVHYPTKVCAGEVDVSM